MRNHIPLAFPATRKALWCHTALGSPISVLLPRVSVSITEQVLFLANGQSRSGKPVNCTLCGEVRVEPDCSEVVLFLNQFESENERQCEVVVGEFRMPTLVYKQSRHELPCTVDQKFIADSHWALTDRARSGHKLVLGEFLSASAICTIFSGSNQIHADVDIDVASANTKFDLTPIESVSVAMTALSKSILGQDKHGIVSNQVKSGYLTMDQYRKVVFLLESDPKVLSIPIIGIWVSGVDLVTDPYIWTSCLRFLHTSQITDRVCKPNEPFLLIHKSPLTSTAQYFDCMPNTTSLSFKLLSGSQGFSMDKECNAKRKGLLSMKLDLQELKTPKGRQFAEYMEEIAATADKENYIINKTPKSKKMMTIINLDDSLPRASPFPVKPMGQVFSPAVPDVSMLEECTPQPMPKPERVAFKQISDNRLNHSPLSKQDNNMVTCRPQREDTTVRKIMFDDMVSEDHQSQNLLNKMLTKPTIPKPSTPSLRTYRTPQKHSRPTQNYHMQPSSTNLVQPSNLDLSFTQESCTKPRKEAKLNSTPRQPPQPTTWNYFQPPVSQQNQFASVAPPPGGPPPPCQCQCQHNLTTDQTPGNHLPKNKTSPLNVITDNVMRMLSPKPSRTRADQLRYSNASTNDSDRVNISPIENVSQCQVMNTPSSHSTHSQSSNGMSPEVQQILKQQDMQLKALQQQIQKLLQAQHNPTYKQSIETQTEPVKNCASVNTGVSLLHHDHRDNEVGSDIHTSTNDSSQSQSLIQHDLTTLDLPTQVTARSFASDINVDYESYDGSPTGSPKRDDGSSEASWQSPVLGESVSMIAESMEQESTKQQLDLIVRNVRDLLSRHTPMKPQTGGNLTSPDQVEDTLERPSPAIDASQADDSLSSSSLSVSSADAGMDHFESTPIPEKKQPKAIEPADVEAATKHQLKKMGIEITTPAPKPSTSKDLPKLEYISMMMSDSVISESNRSIELNALALKYLQDDQLTELAQFTVHKTKQDKQGQASLLRQVLTFNNTQSISPYQSMSTNANMSFATQQYLRRYALTNVSTDSNISDDSSPATQVFDDKPAANLKSILRHTTLSQTTIQVGKQDTNTCQKNVTEKEKDDDDGIQILDIARLKELPKLL